MHQNKKIKYTVVELISLQYLVFKSPTYLTGKRNDFNVRVPRVELKTTYVVRWNFDFAMHPQTIGRTILLTKNAGYLWSRDKSGEKIVSFVKKKPSVSEECVYKKRYALDKCRQNGFLTFFSSSPSIVWHFSQTPLKYLNYKDWEL